MTTIENIRTKRSQRPRGFKGGFTLLELLVVMAIIATLLALAAPRYFASVDKAKETVLRENLWIARDALAKYRADRGKYPDTLEDLVSVGYLRAVPIDPIVESSQKWQLVPATDPKQGAVADIKSGAEGTAIDGTAYRDW